MPVIVPFAVAVSFVTIPSTSLFLSLPPSLSLSYPPTNATPAYFSLDNSLIHGIHVVPIAPCTGLIRPRGFVREEWDTFFTEGRANVEGGWRGILYANLALIDARASYSFFRDGIDGFGDERWIDGGASRTWYLVWAAAWGEFAKAGR
jgi:endo-1,3(4)-beta-glucanase